MVKTSYLHLVLAFILLGAAQSKAQSKSEMEDQAYAYLNSGDYEHAYTMFDKLNAKYPKEYDYKLKLGLCCLSYPDKNARAIEVFQQIKNEYKGPSSDYYLGKAYQVNYKFDEALALLEPLVTTLADSKKPEDKAIVEDATLGIANCKNGKYLVQNKVIAHITNIGAPINTSELEGVPVITADESMMIFTYSGTKSVGGKVDEALKPDPNGKYGLDIYRSYRNADSTWGVPEPISSLNTTGNDAAIALSPEGQRLFIFVSNNKNPGDIYMSKLNGHEFSAPEPLNANINTPDYWEGSCSVSADGRFLYFSSERPGGLGGRDLYVSEMVNGDWGPAVNLGPKINTQYDDDAPFIHPDGITLFFSSKGHLSIGGYDIMFSIKKDNDWTEVKSMGIPLNTTGDDSFYVINSKGDKGFFSSYRANSGGKGNLDIYMVTPGILGEKPVVALYKGQVFGDDKPIEAKIEVTKGQNETVGPYYSNKETGKYLMTFSPGSVYHIKVTADGYETLEEDIDVGSLDKYMEKQKDLRLLSTAAAAAKKAAEMPPAVTNVEPAKTEPTEKPVTTEPVITKEPVKESKTTKTKEPKSSKKNKTEGNDGGSTESTTKTSGGDKSLAPCTDILPDFSPFKGKSLNNSDDYQKLLNVAGNYCAQNLKFKVQIGAYKNPNNFEDGQVKKLGKIDSEAYPDGLTRFTQKQFNTLKEAEAHRQKVIAKGVKDAWIVVFADGKRYTLEDFIMVDFLGKTVN